MLVRIAALFQIGIKNADHFACEIASAFPMRDLQSRVSANCAANARFRLPLNDIVLLSPRKRSPATVPYGKTMNTPYGLPCIEDCLKCHLRSEIFFCALS